MSNRGVHLQHLTHYVYVFLNADGDALYVGCTNDLGARLTQHRQQRAWWHEVARVEVDVHPNMATGLAAEESIIRALKPQHNSVFNTTENPRPTTCGKCRWGKHDECKVTNRNGTACSCWHCAKERAA